MRTVAVILAGGASRRLGRPKQLVEVAPWGEALVHRIARIALEVCDRVAVIEGAVPLADALADLPVTIVENASWDEGIGSSIRAGIAWASSADAALLLTCDQLEVETSHLLRLVGPGLLTASRYAGTLGIPAVFPRAWFPALFALRGDCGARPLLSGAIAIDWPAGERDLDTPADLEALLRR